MGVEISGRISGEILVWISLGLSEGISVGNHNKNCLRSPCKKYWKHFKREFIVTPWGAPGGFFVKMAVGFLDSSLEE